MIEPVHITGIDVTTDSQAFRPGTPSTIRTLDSPQPILHIN